MHIEKIELLLDLLGLLAVCVVLVIHAKQNDTCDEVNEDQNNDTPTDAKIILLFGFVQLLERDDAKDQGEDHVTLENHTDDDKYFCYCFHKVSSLFQFLPDRSVGRWDPSVCIITDPPPFCQCFLTKKCRKILEKMLK